jgi:predicted transcriptional regulator
MKRTTISLPADMAAALGREARRRNTSISAVAREAIAQRLRLTGDEPRTLPFAGVGRSGEHDTARRAEAILAQEWSADRDR